MLSVLFWTSLGRIELDSVPDLERYGGIRVKRVGKPEFPGSTDGDGTSTTLVH